MSGDRSDSDSAPIPIPKNVGFAPNLTMKSLPLLIDRAAVPISPKDLRFVLNLKTKPLPLLIGSLAKRPGNLVFLGEEARVLLGCTMLLDQDDPQNAQWLRLLARAYTLQVARLLPGTGSFTLELPVCGSVTVPRTDEPGQLSVHQYTDACHAALALGDEEALAILGRVPPERLESMKGADLPHLLSEARSMRHYALGEMRPSALLALETVQACNSPALTGGERGFAQMVVSPEMELSTFWRGPAADWDARLRTALELNRRMATWDGLGEPSAAECVALGPLAYAALRYAMGLPSGVTAYELPPALVERRHPD